MKRIRCPKCDEAILFDETKYEPGRILVFECPECHKQFKIRIPQPKVAQPDAEEEEEVEETIYGKLVVLDNAAIKTVDPSMDTTHCIITVTPKPDGTARFVLRDAPSNTGTFLQNEILGNRDRVNISDGDIITLGATTMILRVGNEDNEDEA